MEMTEFIVAFDNGDEIKVRPTSRDLLALEREGLDLQAAPQLEATYRIASQALLRLERTKAIAPSAPIPATWEGLAEVADIDVEDDEGEGSGQVATTGS